MNLSQLTKLDENGARDYLESVRWPNGPACPHCDSKEVTKLQGKSTRPGLYKCKAKECRQQFTVTVGSIFERSHVPLRHWVIAFHLLCSSKKGMSAHQLHRELGCTYKTAWFMFHRIRHAMAQGGGPKFGGTVEADETYLTAKHSRQKDKGRGRGVKASRTVFVLVERSGRARAIPITKVTASNLRRHVRATVDHKAARLMTDDFRSYKQVGRDFGERHGIIKHADGIYAMGDIYTNTAESFFALLKRGIHGVYHHLSTRHLRRYCNEFSFRWSHKQVDDGQRTIAAMRGAEGKRLTYR